MRQKEESVGKVAGKASAFLIKADRGGWLTFCLKWRCDDKNSKPPCDQEEKAKRRTGTGPDITYTAYVRIFIM